MCLYFARMNKKYISVQDNIKAARESSGSCICNYITINSHNVATRNMLMNYDVDKIKPTFVMT